MSVQIFKPNTFRIFLELLRTRLDRSQLENLLEPISSAIRESKTRANEWSGSDPEAHDAIMESECENIEDLLGVSFVICQRYIAAVRPTVEKIHKRAKDAEVTLPFRVDKKAIWGHGHQAGYSQVEVINAFANYFKHCDEWLYEWDMKKYTARVLKQAGAKEGSSSVLRDGARYLGNPDFHDLRVFVTHLAKWRSCLHDDYEKELDRA